jgi:CSLREA domain-containing protein
LFRAHSRREAAVLCGLAGALALSALIGLNAAAASTGLTFNVNSTSDRTDSSVGNGVCRTSAGTCTLRAAIQEANARAGADVVIVPAGTYALAIAPLNQNTITTGDLDITGDLTITGAGAASTFVDGGNPPPGSPPEVRGLDRLFEIHAPATAVSFSDLTIRDGYAADDGGGIHNNTNANVSVARSVVTGNYAGKAGGGIENHLGGTVDVTASTISGNSANESGSALNNNRDGALTVADSTVSGNSAAVVGRDPTLVGAGAIGNNAVLDGRGTIVITGSTIADNASGSAGAAAISNDGAGTVTVERTSFVRNRSEASGGAIFNNAGVVSVSDSGFSESSAEHGGAIYSSGAGSRTVVERSSFSLNRAAARGGAIYNGSTGELSVTDSTFTGNSAADWGGAIVNMDKGSVTVAASAFADNSGLRGGGVANEGTGLVSVVGSTFTGNTAPTGSGGGMHTNSVAEVSVIGGSFSANAALDGGGLSNEGNGTIEVSGTSFTNNTAEQEGGGILVQAGNVTLKDVELADNVANSTVTGGGGISVQGDKSVSVGESVTVVNSRILRNRASETGGGIDSRGDGDVGITGTTIESNAAKVGGGVNHVGDAPLSVLGSTLARNRADGGGGLFTDGDGATTVENSTISANTASEFGGGLLVRSRLTVRSTTVTGNSSPLGGGINKGGGDTADDGVVLLRNTIVAANPTGGNCSGIIMSLGGNIDSGDTCRLRELSDQPATDPLLGPLAGNGGPTETHALAVGSPAQDAAVETTTEPCPPSDQRGVARPQGGGCDVGAVESELAPGPPTAEYCSARVERAALADSDAWVSQSAPNNNFGTDSVLKVRSQTGSNNARALVRFLLPNAPAGCELVGATLRLNASSAAVGRTVQAFRVGSSWSETTVAWSNQPITSGAAAANTSGVGYREWNVIDQTRDMYASGNWGFLIRDAAESGTGSEQGFDSRDGTAAAPQLLLVFDGERPPVTGCTDPSEKRAAADADSWVLQSSAASNYGSDAALKVASKSGGNSRLLVRFGLPPIPTGCRVIDARLRLYASSAKEGRTLRALRLVAPWSETAVTWNNQPATGASAASAASAAEPDYVEWSVTPQVESMYGEGNYGFLVRDAAESSLGAEQSFHSRENGIDRPPELVLRLGDVTPPETTITLGPAATSRNTGASFTFSSSKPGSSFACALDGAAFSPCASPAEYAGLAHGPHTFQVRAIDAGGDVDPSPASYAWTIDTVAPETTIQTRPPDPSKDRSAAFSLVSSEAGSSFECRLDSGDWLACSSTPAYGDLGEGLHSFQARATDPVGNVEVSEASYSWTIDLTAPDTTIGSGPEATTQRTSASFTFASEPGASFECSLDDAAFAACTSPRSYSGLAVGAHEFRVHAIDAAGNVDSSPASYGWTIEPPVDTTAPETTIDSGPSGTTTNTGATFAFSASEAGSTFECSLDGAVFAACTPPRSYAGLAVGNHEFRVRAEDAAGNVDTTPATRTWTVAATCVPSTPTVGASADTWLLQSSSSSNYGNDSAIKVDSKAGGNARVLVRFNLPTIPAGCNVMSARLRLYASSYQAGRTLQALQVSAPWTESAVTWSNQPMTTGTAATVASGSGYREWIVTSQVQSMYTGSNHGFVVRDSVEGGSGIEQAFNSRENGTNNPPRLVLTFGEGTPSGAFGNRLAGKRGWAGCRCFDGARRIRSRDLRRAITIARNHVRHIP